MDVYFEENETTVTKFVYTHVAGINKNINNYVIINIILYRNSWLKKIVWFAVCATYMFECLIQEYPRASECGSKPDKKIISCRHLVKISIEPK